MVAEVIYPINATIAKQKNKIETLPVNTLLDNVKDSVCWTIGVLIIASKAANGPLVNIITREMVTAFTQ